MLTPDEYLLEKLSERVWAPFGLRMVPVPTPPLRRLRRGSLPPVVPAVLLVMLFLASRAPARSSGRSRSKGSDLNLLRRAPNDSTEAPLSRYTVLGARFPLVDGALDRLMSATYVVGLDTVGAGFLMALSSLNGLLG